MPAESAGPLPYTYWVVPGKLLAGPYPAIWGGSGDSRERPRLLLATGVTFFLDLTEENEVRSYEHDLLSEAKAQGITAHYRRKAIPDMTVPTPSLMIEILNTLDAALNAGHTVYVHCLGGIGRTGTVVGCYLVRQGMAGQTALNEIIQLRGGRTNSPETPEQCRLVRDWAED